MSDSRSRAEDREEERTERIQRHDQLMMVMTPDGRDLDGKMWPQHSVQRVMFEDLRDDFREAVAPFEDSNRKASAERRVTQKLARLVAIFTVLLALLPSCSLGIQPPPYSCDPGDDGIRLDTGACVWVDEFASHDVDMVDWVLGVTRAVGADVRELSIHVHERQLDVHTAYMEANPNADFPEGSCVAGFYDVHTPVVHTIPGSLIHELTHHVLALRGDGLAIPPNTDVGPYGDLEPYELAHTPAMGWHEEDQRRIGLLGIPWASPVGAGVLGCKEGDDRGFPESMKGTWPTDVGGVMP